MADLGGLSLEQVGIVLGVSRERVRQIEDVALANLRARLPDLQGADLGDLFRSMAASSHWDDMP